MKTRQELLLQQTKEIVCDMSGLEPDELDGSDTFVELGFDSLFLTQLAGAFKAKFAVPILFRQLLRDLNTIDKLMTYLDTTIPADLWQPETDDDDAGESLVETGRVLIDTSLKNVQLSDSVDEQFATGSLRGVFIQQLQLMQQQLAVIQGGSLGVSAPSDKAESKAVTTPPTQAPAMPPSVEQDEPIKLPPGFGPQVDEESLSKEVPANVARYMEDLTLLYCQKTKTSKALAQKHRKTHADPRTAAGFNLTWKELVYPIVTKKSRGAYLWDVDNNKYIDLLNGFGPNFLGHSPDFVTKALRKQLSAGIEVGPQTQLAGQVADMVCDLTGLDRATFVNTGSEAVQAAIRVARTVTGKEDIVVFNYDYHGNFDEMLVKGIGTGARRRTRPLAPGIPVDAVEHIIVLDYGSDEALQIIEDRCDSIAAVLVEPIQSRHPENRPIEFIVKLRALTENTNIALVFDEVITGFRTGLGGAQEYYGIQADMATYGKIVGGGMPIGVVAGKSSYMDTFDGGFWQYGDNSYPSAGVTFFAGTFVRHPMAMAAAHASLTWLAAQDQSLYDGVYRLTSRLSQRLNRLFEIYGVGIHVAYFSSQMYFRISVPMSILGCFSITQD